MRRFYRSWPVGLLAGLLLAGFGAAAAEPVKVVATFSILGDMIKSVAGDRIALTTIVGGDGDSELYQPTPGDAKAVAEAKLLVMNGLNEEFEPWLDGLVKQANFRGAKLVASKGVKPMSEADEKGEGKDAAKLDQHAWHDVANAIIYVRNIADGLAKADPANAAEYRGRADAYAKELRELDGWAKGEIAAVPKAKRKVITSHDAFQYLARAYGVTMIAARGWSNEREASAEDVARLLKQIRQDRVKAIFVENMNDPRLIQRIAQEAGATIGGTLYSDSLSKPGGEADSYVKMVHHNIAALKEAMLKN